MSRALAHQQQALLAALWAPDLTAASRLLVGHAGQGSSRGLQAYRSHGRELAQRVLQAAYPVLAQLVHEDNFEPLARAFWQAHPPAGGDLAQWGGALAEFVQGAPQLADEPYLADVARVEWALHCCATAADDQADPASFSLLAAHDPAALTLDLAPGIACVQSAWPVVSVIHAHLLGQPTLAEAGKLLDDGVGETALVWRQGYRPQLRLAQPGEAAFVAALQGGASLHDALAQSPALDFNGWLAPAVQGGQLMGARLLPSPTPPMTSRREP